MSENKQQILNDRLPVPPISIREYATLRNKTLVELIRDAPENLIKRMYALHFGKSLSVEEFFAQMPPVEKMRTELLKIERPQRRETRDFYFPPIESDFFEWGDIRDLMAETGCKMVSKVGVGELMLLLETKAREWTRRAIAIAKEGEVTPELMMQVIEEDSKRVIQEARKVAVADTIITGKLRQIMKVSNRMLQSQLRDILGLDEKGFNEQIIEWANKFGFWIDGEYILFKASEVDAFIEALDAEFVRWDKKERKDSEKG